ncbi:MAG: hypothetical protein DIU84_01405, partial [Bacillota bacterium]
MDGTSQAPNCAAPGAERAAAPGAGPGSGRQFLTLSGQPVKAVYRPEDAPIDYARDLGDPGRYPFTRGPYETMYRGRLWPMPQFAGSRTAARTQRR